MPQNLLSLRTGIFLCAAILCLQPMASQACRILDGAQPLTPMEAVAEASNKFGFGLYNKIAAKKPTENQFMSPYSVFIALAMTSEGAANESLEILTKTLGLPATGDLHAGVSGLAQALSPADAPYALAVANAIWPEKSFDMKPEFLKTIQEIYGGASIPQDFKRDFYGARKTINAWVEQKTNNRIKDLIPEGALSRLTRMVLINAIYFKGAWKSEFDKQLTQEQPFTLEDGSKVNVQLMHQAGIRRFYAEVEGIQVLQIPYKGDALSMVILLPKSGEMAKLEAKLDAALWAKIMRFRTAPEVNVWLPRFKMEIGGSIKDPLKAMGMEVLFDERADFSRMFSDKDPLLISDVIHKAFVEVNEEGTEAAAATAVIVSAVTSVSEPQPPVNFRADHPFIFMIQHDVSQSILFMGKVMKPN